MSGLRGLVENATPGPWAVGHGAFRRGDVHSKQRDQLVAKAWPGVGARMVSEEDNARLIALAPSLALWAADAAEQLVCDHDPLCCENLPQLIPCQKCALLARFAAIDRQAQEEQT